MCLKLLLSGARHRNMHKGLNLKAGTRKNSRSYTVISTNGRNLEICMHVTPSLVIRRGLGRGFVGTDRYLSPTHQLHNEIYTSELAVTDSPPLPRSVGVIEKLLKSITCLHQL